MFELNANSHDLTRALANAYTITALQRRPYIDVISSANAFQVDGQNDNGWDQGLIFMDQAKVWMQPPYYVHQMIAASQRRQVVRADVAGAGKQVQVTAFRDSGGVSLDIVNVSAERLAYDIDFGRAAADARVEITTLGDDRGRAVNTAENPVNIVPASGRAGLDHAGRLHYELAPRSFTTMRVQR